MAACAEGAVGPKNVIILFADGVAATQWELGRYSARVLRNQSFAATDVVFKDGVFGLLSTDSRDALVTDSAAAASAMSTGVKVDNFAVSMTPDGKAHRTAMEAAKSASKKIGLVTTAEIYDASPAAFSVHAKNRSDAQSIVDQYLAMEPDVLIGGGRDYFLPKSAPGGKRSDGKDMIAAFEQKGYRIARDTRELKNADGAKLLGLFADEDTSFSDFVLNARLAHAYRLLTDPRRLDRNISSLAFEAGFGDLSYFNRAFRRRYGTTPSEVRAAVSR